MTSQQAQLDRVSDRAFLDQFDLARPSMNEAAALLKRGEEHAAALSAARHASEGPVRGAILEKDVAATRERVLKWFPRAVDLEIETASLLMMKDIPSREQLGFVGDHRIGIRARFGRARGNDVLICALIYGMTNDPQWAHDAISMGLKNASEIKPHDEVEFPAAYDWHPRSARGAGHDVAHRVQYWMQAWPLLNAAMTDEQRLEWMKVIILAARGMLKANRHEVPHNLTFHGLAPELQVAAAFPALREAAQWRKIMEDRLSRDFSALPFITADGYAREGSSYQNVNTRLLMLCHLTYLRAYGIELLPLRQAAESAFHAQSMFVTPDGLHWLTGDGGVRASHEHWQDGHESLHLGAALFSRPEWKALSGSIAGAQPELLNAWLMGPEGLDRWAAMPAVEVRKRAFVSAHAEQSGIHVLRAGRGLDAHAGLLWFASEHNHGHHDKGQALIYGLGRHLISDPGFAGYGPGDADPMRSVQIHALASPIRHIPLGPRTDYGDYAMSLGYFEGKNIQVALGQSLLFENHVIQRALALVTPWGEADNGKTDAFWVIWDRIAWKRGWPASANEPFELIDTRFPFHAPGCGAQISIDGRSAWSRYDGPQGPPFAADAPPRREFREAFEASDSDANIQVSRLGNDPRELWDVHIVPGVSSQGGDKPWPRPVAVYRWRGRLPHVAAYVLAPFRGLRETPFANASGAATADGLECRVMLPKGNVQVAIDGLAGGAIRGSVKIG